MKRITETIKTKYYRFNPGEYLPIYTDGKWANKNDFHRYMLSKIAADPKGALHYFTHTSG